MSRMLEALKQLERRGAKPTQPDRESVAATTPWTVNSDDSIVEGFDPYGLDQPANVFAAAPYLDSVAQLAKLDERFDGAHQPIAAKAPLSLRLVADDYQPISRQLVEIIDLRGSRIFVVQSVSVDTDEALSLPTLGLALAGELGRRVLIIHTDRRLRSTLENAPSEPLVGLSDALSGVNPWTDAIHRTSQPSLDLIPRGEAPIRGGSLSELNFPGSWAAEYGAVLIGCHSSSQPLAIELARLADATIFAVRNGTVHRDTLQKIGAKFQAAGARPTGCVVLD
jgi:hypothetical protein